MSSLFALLSQRTPDLQTGVGLIVTGLQKDFTLPDGKLPVQQTDFIDRLAALVPRFRERGDVIWVRSEYAGNRPVNGPETSKDTVIAGSNTRKAEEVPFISPSSRDGRRDDHVPTKRCKVEAESWTNDDQHDSTVGDNYPVAVQDDELFLSRTSTREPCCLPGSKGAEYDDRAQHLQTKADTYIVKSHYSAFESTSLLLSLRSRLITELFICGCMTNLSVYSTAMDAARYGIRIVLVEDCLGYRREDRHDLAIKQLRDIMEAQTMTSAEVIEYLNDPHRSHEEYYGEEDDESEDVDDIAKQQSTDAKDDVLEADESASDDEITLPVVRLTRLLDKRLDLRQPDNSRTRTRLAAATPSIASHSSHPSDHATPGPELSKFTDPSTKDPATRVLQTEPAKTWTKFETAPDRDRLGSSEMNKQPWLRLIPSSSSDADHENNTPRSSHPGLAALSAVVGLSQSTVREYEEAMSQTQQEQQMAMASGTRCSPLFGDNTEAESGGSRILYNLLPDDLAGDVFDRLNGDITWRTMHHQTGEVPRLVCCQCTVGEDGSVPVYRHPSDRTLPSESWSSTVDQVRRAAEKVVGHPLNHALIQLYRNGRDYISEHSDKTLDIVPGSFIVNVSLGAQRTMRLRTKRSASKSDPLAPMRTTHRVPMPHNSMITMSLDTNASYLHGINADKRLAMEQSDAEKAYGGQRLSLTFRHIGTFLGRDSRTIWGQGAVGKTREAARPVVNGDVAESERLVRAFGRENQVAGVVWEEVYGRGFDVLHLKGEVGVDGNGNVREKKGL